MNTFNFLKIGGFPLETDTLHEMQAAYNIFNSLGALAGDLTIISGCVVTGSIVGDGVVYVNGEIFDFVGGNIQTTVRILETPTSKEFENRQTKEIFKKRYVTFASGTGAMNWSEFMRLDTLKNIQSRILPPLTNPQLYTGSLANIPEGWQLCDGSNGTPDLRGQFIVGYDPTDADYDVIGKTGGEKAHTLTESEMPSHNHSGTTNSAGSHTHSLTGYIQSGSNDGSGGEAAGYFGTKSTNSAGAHTHTFTTDSKGSGAAHGNRPPFYTLAYIIYTGN